MRGVDVFPINEAETLLKGAERELRPCPFLPVFLLLFLTTATTATMTVTVPGRTRPAMTAMMGTMD